MQPTQLAERILVYAVDTDVSMVLPWDIDSVVSLRGSFRTQPDFAAGEEVIQDLLVGMLDKGTEKQSKLAISALLEDCGASIQFSSSHLGVRFDARCLKSDLPLVLRLLNEQLRTPAFSEREFDLLKDRFLANIQRMEFDTGSRASDALSRHIYAFNHPSRAIPLPDLIHKIEQTGVEDIRRYWQSMVGVNHFSVVTVGDVSRFHPREIFSSITEGLSAIRFSPAKYELNPGHQYENQEIEHIEIADRSNLDVLLGHGLPLLKRSPDFLPLYLSVFALGGNFSSRLMSTIRDRDGLTYGIRSSLSGIHTKYPGAWITNVTLSREKLDAGIEKTKSEIRSFIEETTPEPLIETCKTTLIGSHQIQLSTTVGLAATLLSNQEEGFPIERIDTYSEEIRSVSLNEVDLAKEKYLMSDQIKIVTAGTL
ncbi:MAG: pitrilysin family protein [Bacteroidetes bacterium]|nr:pitrilysin family protein [Bacteroidota bacterium]